MPAHVCLIHNTILPTKIAEDLVGKLVQEVLGEIVEIVVEVVVVEVHM